MGAAFMPVAKGLVRCSTHCRQTDRVLALLFVPPVEGPDFSLLVLPAADPGVQSIVIPR
jgi:hypothetical protein